MVLWEVFWHGNITNLRWNLQNLISSGSTYIHFCEELIKLSEGRKQNWKYSWCSCAFTEERIDVKTFNTSFYSFWKGFPIQHPHLHNWRNISQGLYFKNPLIGKEREKTCAIDDVIDVLWYPGGLMCSVVTSVFEMVDYIV